MLSKKKMFRPAVSLISTGALLIALLSGCSSPSSFSGSSSASAATQSASGGTSSSAAAPSEDGNLTAPGEFPIVKEKETLTIFTTLRADVEDMSTNEFTKELEDITNVHIEWQLAPAANFTEKRNLVLASGNYPDAFMDSGFTNTELLMYSSQGVIIPLNDLIEKNMVHFKKYLSTRDGLEEALTAPDGNIYSLGNDQLCYHCRVANKLWMNQAWLDKLGIAMPSTTEEFYAALKAFKTQDPNGNGKNDEIPLVAQATDISTFLMNAFTYDDGVNHLQVNNGKVEVAFNKEEWREGIRYFKTLYDEGLLDPTSFTLTMDQVKTLVEKSELPTIGAVPALHPGSFANLTSNKYQDFQAVPPLKGPDGNQTCGWKYNNGSYNVFVVTSACKNPDLAVRWADYIYSSTEASVRARLGRQGHEWDYADEGEKSVSGNQAVWKKLTALGTESQNIYWGAYAYTSVFDHSEQTGGANGYENILYDATLKYDPYKPAKEQVMPPIWLDSSVVDQAAQYATDLKDYVNESFAKFVTGDQDIEKDWDAYLKELNVIGLEDYLSIYQAAYDAIK